MSYIDLTIITPSYNSESTIESTCVSIQSLVSNGAEHIIVDSYSTDSTLTIAKRFSNTILHYPKGNMYEAINFGIKHSTRKYITYINSDDLLHAHEILKLQTKISKCDLLYGNISFIDIKGVKLFSRRSAPSILLNFVGRYYNPIFQQGMIFKRELFDRIGPFDTSYRYSADMDFILNAIYSGATFYKTNSLLGSFRLSESQLSTREWDIMQLEGPVIRQKLINKFNLKTNFLSKYVSRLIRYIYNLDLIILGYVKFK